MHKRKQVFLFTIIMIVSVVFLMVLSQLGKVTLSSFLIKETVYSNKTYLGSVNISHLTQDQAAQKVRNRIADWKREQRVTLSWQSKSVVIPDTAYHFDVEQSVNSVVNGQQNPLKVVVTNDALNRSLQNMNFSFMDDLSEDSFQEALINSVQYLTNDNKNITVASLFQDASKGTSQTLHEVALQDLPHASMPNRNLTFVIGPDEVFSFKKAFKSLHSQGLSWKSLNEVSSAFYEDALYSDLEIIERHISNTKPSSVALGTEAKVSEDGKDLKLHNPNNYALTFSINSLNNQWVVALTGTADPLTYKINIKINDEVKARTIIETKNMHAEVKQVQTPEDGYDVSVVKQTYYHNQFISTEIMSRDIYIPLHDDWEVSSGNQNLLNGLKE